VSKHECVILPLLPHSLFPLNTVWELEARALTTQELLSTVATKCETVVLYVRYRPLRELLKQYMPPDRIIQVTAGSYGPELLKHNTLLYIVGFRDSTSRELHIVEVRIKKNAPHPL
jgi:tRNA U34 2-thiouridine synthase MnmA/TrmU